MNWSNVKLILGREVRDQLRDRRTLFMIVVLPMLLYPLLGMSTFQVAQFMREHATRVLVIGGEELPPDPPLLEPDTHRFHPDLFEKGAGAKLLELELRPHPRHVHAEDDGDAPQVADQPPDTKRPNDTTRRERTGRFAAEAIESGEFEVVVYFPPDFADRLSAFRRRLLQRRDEPSAGERPLVVPNPEIFFDTSKEKSRIAHNRVSQVLNRWTRDIGAGNLKASRLPPTTAKPFDLQENDVAREGHAKSAIWSKLLPFVLIIWSLTGAFYPAVDLCAGEKERGTLETLLSSPAQRSEIVVGKLLTVMIFSVSTAVLNLLSMGLTGLFVMKQLSGLVPVENMGAPSLESLVWLLPAIVPLSAMFSALCLALAAFARSTKEGQYYLMPLMLITLPLMMLPMAPGVELTLGNSLIPVTGVLLLLREALQGNYAEALRYLAPVLGVTLACCVFAVRWAIDQFNKESVLFRESERLDMGLWLRHLYRDRSDTPSAAEGMMCALLIMMSYFFVGMTLPMPEGFRGFAVLQSIVQIAFVAAPALLMAVMLSRSPRRTLLLKCPPLLALPAAVLLAVAVHPVAMALNHLVQFIYPPAESVEQVGKFLGEKFQGVPLGWVILIMAVVPGICEELAFRGFILSGFRHFGHKWRAIVLSSLFFGATHMILQQSLSAAALGILIGYLAVQSGSIFPCMLFHVTHNSLMLASGEVTSREEFKWLTEPLEGSGFMYQWWIVAIGGAITVALVMWLRALPYHKSDEEVLQEALEKSAHAPAG